MGSRQPRAEPPKTEQGMRHAAHPLYSRGKGYGTGVPVGTLDSAVIYSEKA